MGNRPHSRSSPRKRGPRLSRSQASDMGRRVRGPVRVPEGVSRAAAESVSSWVPACAGTSGTGCDCGPTGTARMTELRVYLEIEIARAAVRRLYGLVDPRSRLRAARRHAVADRRDRAGARHPPGHRPRAEIGAERRARDALCRAAVRHPRTALDGARPTSRRRARAILDGIGAEGVRPAPAARALHRHRRRRDRPARGDHSTATATPR